jgi:hypothetical protein
MNAGARPDAHVRQRHDYVAIRVKESRHPVAAFLQHLKNQHFNPAAKSASGPLRSGPGRWPLAAPTGGASAECTDSKMKQQLRFPPRSKHENSLMRPDVRK